MVMPISIADLLRQTPSVNTANRPLNVGMADPNAPYPQEDGGPLRITARPISDDMPLGNTETLSGRIQQWLGAKDTPQGGRTQEILAGRARPSDIADAAVATLFGQKPVSSQSFADARMQQAMERMDAIQKQQLSRDEFGLKQKSLDETIRSNKATEATARMKGGADQSGGATGVLIKRYMDATGASFPDALYAVQTGMRQNMTSNNGQITPLPGAVDAKGQMAFGNKLGADRGEALAAAQVDLPRLRDNAQNTIKQLNELENHPGLSTSVGLKGVTGGALFGQVIPGTDAADFKAKLQKINGEQFLQAYTALRGSGSISEIEGAKAEQAIASMQTAQSERAFKQSVEDFKSVIQTGLARAEANAQRSYYGQENQQPARSGADDVMQYMTPEERALFQ